MSYLAVPGPMSRPESALSPFIVDMDHPYPMGLPNLGHAVIINNLATQVPDSVQCVETFTTTLTKIGFKVNQRKDMNFQGMKQIKKSMTKEHKHQRCNCFLFAIICHAMEQGWLLDVNKRRAYTLEQLTDEVCGVQSLQGKPKVVLVEEYGSGEYTTADIQKEIEKDDLYIVCSSSSKKMSFLKTLGLRLSEMYSTQSFADVVNSINQTIPAPVEITPEMEPLTDAELARLAPKISSVTMQNIAVQRLGFTDAQVKTIIHQCWQDMESFVREILVRWRNKNATNSRKRLFDIFRDATSEGRANLEAVCQVLQVARKDELTIKVFDGFTQKLHFGEYSPPKRRTPAQTSSLDTVRSPSPFQPPLPMLPPGGTAVTSSPVSPSPEPMNLSTEPDRKRLRTSNSLTQQAPTGFLGWTSTMPTDHVINMTRGPPPYSHFISQPAQNSSVYQDNTVQPGRSSTQVIPGIHSINRSAANESIEGQILSSQRPVSMEPHVRNVMHPGSGSQPPLQEALSKGKCRLELQMSASCDIKEWWRMSAITAIESKNQVVIHGRRTASDPLSLYTFQRNLNGTVKETRMDHPCQHDALFGYKLITVVQNGKELVAVLCEKCNDIKLVDMETEQVTSVIKSPVGDLDGMCPGPDSGLFVTVRPGNILQLNSSFNVTRTLDLSSFFNERLLYWWFHHVTYMCHLPAPHNTLVVNNRYELRAVSLPDGRQVWSQKCEGFTPNCLLFCPQQDVLLVSVWVKPEVRVLNPSDGSILQTIEIPNIHYIYSMCLCNDQIVMTQWAEMDTFCELLSYYNIKRVS